MLPDEGIQIIEDSMDSGWVIEPLAKRIFQLAGLDVPRFVWAKEEADALRFADKTGYPVVAKIVSHKIIHKSDVHGVVVGIRDREALAGAFGRLRQLDGFEGVLVEEQMSGREFIIGAKKDSQFGPVVLFGAGGTMAEIYQDVSLRMAPLSEEDALSMIHGIKAHRLIEGYRGTSPLNADAIRATLRTFSNLIMDMEAYFESIDLNPVICSSERCVITDARIMLKTVKGEIKPFAYRP